jgi:hypothetical protein
MSLDRLKNALTRVPFFQGEKARNVAADSPTRGKSVLSFGDESSAMHLSMLETLRDAVRVDPMKTRGLVIGLPFDRVERTLASVGFDTAENLISFNAVRKSHRFRDRDGITWHIADSEFGRVGGMPQLAPGAPYPIPPSFRFLDRETVSGNQLRHRHTERVTPRPTELFFVETFSPSEVYGFDGVAGGLAVGTIMDRLHRLHQGGLNATIFLKNILVLIEAYGKPLTTVVLFMMVTDLDSRMTMLEYFAVHLETMPPGERTDAVKAAFETIWAGHENPPKMAVELVNRLFDETFRGREMVPARDLLLPGKIWHIETVTPEDRYTAWCLKQEMQKQALAQPEGDDRTLIFAGEWESFVIPDVDSRCLERRDILECFGVAKTKTLLEANRDEVTRLIRAFPRQFWHLSQQTASVSLFHELHPHLATQGRPLNFIPWEMRLESTAETLREAPVDLDVDGIREIERTRQSKLKRIVDRGGFAVD